MYSANLNSTSGHTDAYSIIQQANRLKEIHDTSLQIIRETSEAIRALTEEFNLQLIEVASSSDLDALDAWLPPAQAELERKTNELNNKCKKRLEELGLRK